MNTITRKKRFIINNKMFIFKIDFETIIELEERYNNATSIYISFFGNSTTSMLFNNITKLLAAATKNVFITEKELQKLLISKYKTTIKAVDNTLPIVMYLLDGFIIENDKDNENEELFNENEEENTENDIKIDENEPISNLLKFDSLYAKALSMGLTQADFLKSTPKAILTLIDELYPTDNKNGSNNTRKTITDSITGEELIIDDEVDGTDAFFEMGKGR